MRDYVQRERERQAHAAFVQRKVDAARGSIDAGQGRSNDAVETDFAARRVGVADRA